MAARLAYFGDVPVEASHHGSALLYRLLCNRGANTLRVVEGIPWRSQPERRIPGVEYRSLRVAQPRLHNSRLSPFYATWLTAIAPFRTAALSRALEGFNPEAVLTVVHGYSWITAAHYARRAGLPLHLICHDDWPRTSTLHPSMTGWLDRKLRRIYRQAISRLCVSPTMRAIYRDRFGVDGEVLYPSRAADCPVFGEPAERLSRPGRDLTIAFAGTFYEESISGLKQLAAPVAAMGGRILAFGPISKADFERVGLNQKPIEHGGLLKSADLIRHLRSVADVMYLPMDFGETGRTAVEANFPSKLTDYTATGLPILIHGPPWGSAVRWAAENPGVAEVVQKQDDSSLAAAVNRLADSSELRLRFARRALDVGKLYFSYTAAQTAFDNALLRGRPVAAQDLAGPDGPQCPI